jgi:glycosyltransferase involved in cell wall biosynthesis
LNASNSMKISIVMATYNGAKYLQEQLDSFINQTRLPDELVICDDVSNDETIAILNGFKKEAQFPVRIYINDKNLGHEGNFGKAIGLCTGQIIFLSDQDDVWFPEKLLTVEKVFESQPKTLVVINDLEITDAYLQLTGQTVLGQIRESGIIGKDEKGFIIGCGTAFRSELKAIILPIPELNFGHDKWIHNIALALGNRFVLEQKLQLYRRHESNASSWAFDAKKHVTWQEMVRSSAEMDMVPFYAKHRAALNIIESRLIALGPKFYINFEISQSYSVSLSEIVSAQSALIRRISLIQSTWLKRKILAASMLFRGDYKYFLGMRSFAKDLLR